MVLEKKRMPTKLHLPTTPGPAHCLFHRGHSPVVYRRLFVRSWPLTAGYSALIFTQALVKDKSDRYLHWLAQASTLKGIETPAFHDDIQVTIQFDGSTSDSLKINSRVKQGCILAPTLFSIYFAALLHCPFQDLSGDVNLHNLH